MALEYTTAGVFIFGLLGYVGFGYFSKTFLRAMTYSFLWAVAVYILLGALAGDGQHFGFDASPACFVLNHEGAVIFDATENVSGAFNLFAVCFTSHQIVAIIVTIIFYAWGKFYNWV